MVAWTGVFAVETERTYTELYTIAGGKQVELIDN